jgi:hypothetical protein
LKQTLVAKELNCAAIDQDAADVSNLLGASDLHRLATVMAAMFRLNGLPRAECLPEFIDGPGGKL